MNKLIEELTALSEKAAPGPWVIDDYDTESSFVGIDADNGKRSMTLERRENVALIVAMRNALPDVLRELKKSAVRKHNYEFLERKHAAAVARAKHAEKELKAAEDHIEELLPVRELLCRAVSAESSAKQAVAHLKHEEEYSTRLVERAEKAEKELEEQRVIAGRAVSRAERAEKANSQCVQTAKDACRKVEISNEHYASVAGKLSKRAEKAEEQGRRMADAANRAVERAEKAEAECADWRDGRFAQTLLDTARRADKAEADLKQVVHDTNRIHDDYIETSLNRQLALDKAEAERDVLAEELSDKMHGDYLTPSEWVAWAAQEVAKRGEEA